VDFALGPSFEIVIAGAPRAADTGVLLRAVRRPHVPDKVVLLRPTDRKAPPITRLAPFTRYYTDVEDRAAACDCRDFLRVFPATDPAQVKNLLENPQNRLFLASGSWYTLAVRHGKADHAVLPG